MMWNSSANWSPLAIRKRKRSRWERWIAGMGTSVRNPLRRRRRDEDPWKGLVAGLAGGIAGTLAMTGFQLAWSWGSEKVAGGNGGPSSRGKSPSPEGHTGDEWGESPRSGASSEKDSDPATERASPEVAHGLLGRHLSERQKKLAGHAVHIGFGTVMGGAYGVACEYFPSVASTQGLPYGAGLMLVADEIAVPALGLADPPHKTPASTHLYSLASHLVYGVVCELTRRSVRKML